MAASEKSWDVLAECPGQSVLSSPVLEGIIANAGVICVFRWRIRRYSLQFRLSGGEGGIRTLGTGVSPYNGLAKGSFSPPSLVLKSLQSDWTPLSRTQGLSFGTYCAPLCAPFFRDALVRVRPGQSPELLSPIVLFNSLL